MQTPLASIVLTVLFSITAVSQTLTTLRQVTTDPTLEVAPIPEALSTLFSPAKGTLEVASTPQIAETLKFVWMVIYKTNLLLTISSGPEKSSSMQLGT
jgi:hypothetical protein